jgi:hypothetical protein
VNSRAGPTVRNSRAGAEFTCRPNRPEFTRRPSRTEFTCWCGFHAPAQSYGIHVLVRNSRAGPVVRNARAGAKLTRRSNRGPGAWDRVRAQRPRWRRPGFDMRSPKRRNLRRGRTSCVLRAIRAQRRSVAAAPPPAITASALTQLRDAAATAARVESGARLVPAGGPWLLKPLRCSPGCRNRFAPARAGMPRGGAVRQPARRGKALTGTWPQRRSGCVQEGAHRAPSCVAMAVIISAPKPV